MSREHLTQAVALAISLKRGFYIGLVAQEKQKELAALESYMSGDEFNEYTRRVRE